MHNASSAQDFPEYVGAVQQYVFGPLELFTVQRLLSLERAKR